MMRLIDSILQVSLFLLVMFQRIFCVLGTLAYGGYITFVVYQTHQIPYIDILYFLLLVFVISVAEFLIKK